MLIAFASKCLELIKLMVIGNKVNKLECYALSAAHKHFSIKYYCAQTFFTKCYNDIVQCEIWLHWRKLQEFQSKVCIALAVHVYVPFFHKCFDEWFVYTFRKRYSRWDLLWNAHVCDNISIQSVDNQQVLSIVN